MSLNTTFMVRCTRCQNTFNATMPIPTPTVGKPKPRPKGEAVSTDYPHCEAEFRVRVG